MTTIALLGATGRTGRHVIEQARTRGIAVRALARDPEKLAGLGVEVVPGDVRDTAALRTLFTGADAVVSALGTPRLRTGGLHAPAMQGIVDAMHEAGVRRYVALSSTGARFPDDPRSLRAAIGAMGALAPAYLADKQAEADALRASDLEWTLLRVTNALSDGTGGSLTVTTKAPPLLGMVARPTQRQAVASALLDAVVDGTWARQAPFAHG